MIHEFVNPKKIGGAKLEIICYKSNMLQFIRLRNSS
jgi:hypothetical protein